MTGDDGRPGRAPSTARRDADGGGAAVTRFDVARVWLAFGILVAEAAIWLVVMVAWERGHRAFLPPWILGAAPHAVGLVSALVLAVRRRHRALLAVAWVCVVVSPIIVLAALTWAVGATGD